MPKRIPVRTCIGCGQKKEKNSLMRIVRLAGSEEELPLASSQNIRLDMSGRQNGRGVYLCRSLACFQLAEKKRGLEKSLSMRIPKEVYRELEASLLEEGLSYDQ